MINYGNICPSDKDIDFAKLQIIKMMFDKDLLVRHIELKNEGLCKEVMITFVKK